jgi:hypothetical protein
MLFCLKGPNDAPQDLLSTPMSQPSQKKKTRRSTVKHGQPSVATLGQPSVATLAEHGIRVRDFVYESPLPPIPSISRVPRQIQPSRIPLKRFRDKEASSSDGEDTSHAKKPRALERQATEPVLDIPSQRLQGYTDIRYAYWERKNTAHAPSPFEMNALTSRYHTPPRVQYPANPGASPSPHNASPSQFQSPLQDTSQESEPHIDTPQVTPNGSLQWAITDSSSIPASQLDTSSPVPLPEPLSYSQIGLRTPPSQPTALLRRDTSPFALSPLSPLSSTPSLSSSQLAGPTTSTLTGAAASSPFRQSLSAIQPVVAAHTSPRYHLRKRPAPGGSPAHQASSGITRRLSFSAQSPPSKSRRRHRKQVSKPTVATSAHRRGRGIARGETTITR